MASLREQRLQFAQRLHAHDWLVGRVHLAAGASVEHPHWDLDRMGVEVRRQTTPNEFLVLESPRAMDPDGATEPRMPAIAHRQRLGTMGVPLLACKCRAAGMRTQLQLQTAMHRRRPGPAPSTTWRGWRCRRWAPGCCWRSP